LLRRTIILADGDIAARADLDAAWPAWAEGVARVIAADGGARHAPGLGLTIDRWVGDGDSLDRDEIERLRAAGTRVELVDRDKDQSDTELAIDAAIDDGADELVILGAFGGPRIDHAIANLSLLAHPAIGRRPAILLDAAARVRLVQAPGPDGAALIVPLPGRIGDLVSLIPFGADVETIRTAGLRYPLRDESLRIGSARGLSNVRVADDASMIVGRGRLLVIETPATLSR
jgi:thiamine pyrophosphokinase